MRTSNRGDVPAPHVAPRAATYPNDPAEDVMFDPGSLSFVQDWVEGAGGKEETPEVEPVREDPRKSNPNRRLGVGAQPKKPKQDRPEPSALEKKLRRKRQRQELSDAIAGEVDTHGVADGDQDGESESKTASFKGKKRGRAQGASPVTQDAPAAAVGDEDTKSKKERSETTSRSGDDMAGRKDAGDMEERGDTQARKRKGKRKKRKTAATASAEEAQGAADKAQPSAPAAVEETLVAEAAANAEHPEEPEPETKKQRRGWGKPRSKSAAPAVGDSHDAATVMAAGDGTTDEHRKRKKSRSRQKNIRKDKRSMENRPSYLRPGDPGFCGRDLTDETRKFLGLPANDFDSTSPAGGGEPGKPTESPGWVIDNKPGRVPQHLTVGGENIMVEKVKIGVAVDPMAKVVPAAGAHPLGKSKYKNLALPPMPEGRGGRVRKKSKKKRRSVALSSRADGRDGNREAKSAGIEK